MCCFGRPLLLNPWPAPSMIVERNNFGSVCGKRAIAVAHGRAAVSRRRECGNRNRYVGKGRVGPVMIDVLNA
jgi:hypothetical protein